MEYIYNVDIKSTRLPLKVASQNYIYIKNYNIQLKYNI